jgi:hypothetical protein
MTIGEQRQRAEANEVTLKQAAAASLSRFREAERKTAEAHKAYTAARAEQDLQYDAYRDARRKWAEAAIDLLPEIALPLPIAQDPAAGTEVGRG